MIFTYSYIHHYINYIIAIDKYVSSTGSIVMRTTINHEYSLVTGCISTIDQPLRLGAHGIAVDVWALGRVDEVGLIGDITIVYSIHGFTR